MIRNFAVLFALFLLLSCNQPGNQLAVSVSREDSAHVTRIYDMQIRNSDSIFYYKAYRYFKAGDTLKFNSLPNGEYELSFLDILGIKKTIMFNFNDSQKQRINMSFGSIDTRNSIPVIPLNNLKNEESYKVEREGGSVAAGYGYYKVSRLNDGFYFESPYRIKKRLTLSQVDAVKKFEAELFAIDSTDVCMSTGRMHYKIISDRKITEITDNTCNWYGWETLMRQIPIDEHNE